MYLYQPGQNGDSELLAWYLRLIDDGDLTKLFGSVPQPLAAFVKDFTDPVTDLVYDADEQGWWIVGWVKPFMAGASWGLWVRPDKRGSAAAVEFTLKLHELAFEQYPVLVLGTRQEHVVAQMGGLGYTAMGTVPDLFGVGEPGHVMHLHRTVFASTLELWKDKAHGRSSR